VRHPQHSSRHFPLTEAGKLSSKTGHPLSYKWLNNIYEARGYPTYGLGSL